MPVLTLEAMPSVIIMCKAPVPGAVKTRLLTAFSAEEAANLHRAMASTVILRARRLFETVCIAADDPEHPFFEPFNLPVVNQGQGDLGQRMQRLLGNCLTENSQRVIFLGTDSPHMADQRLLDAARALDENDVVLGAVEDGGYDLVGLRGNWPLFQGVEWSTSEVLDQTESNCRKLGLSCLTLEPSFDIDTPEDLKRAMACGWKPGD